jgi:hypothetical protein
MEHRNNCQRREDGDSTCVGSTSNASAMVAVLTIMNDLAEVR